MVYNTHKKAGVDQTLIVAGHKKFFIDISGVYWLLLVTMKLMQCYQIFKKASHLHDPENRMVVVVVLLLDALRFRI